jgi:hypothetical protein
MQWRLLGGEVNAVVKGTSLGLGAEDHLVVTRGGDGA